MEAVSGHLESVRDAVGLGFKRDAVGRVYVEDGMARMQPHVGIQALSGALHSATTGAMTQTQAALASTWSVSAGFVSSSAVQTLKIGEVIVATSEVIAGSGFRRDAIGRVVVEDGLRRMQPRGEGAHAEALRTARGAWSQTHEALAGTWNASALAAAGTWKASAVFVSSSATQSIRLGEGLGGAVGFGPRRDAIGRVVVEDGLARMQNRTPPATVALTALDDAKDALLDSYTGLTALSSDLLSRSSTAVASLTHASGDLVSSAGNVLVIEHCRRDAVGRIYVEDGLARMQVCDMLRAPSRCVASLLGVMQPKLYCIPDTGGRGTGCGVGSAGAHVTAGLVWCHSSRRHGHLQRPSIHRRP